MTEFVTPRKGPSLSGTLVGWNIYSSMHYIKKDKCGFRPTAVGDTFPGCPVDCVALQYIQKLQSSCSPLASWEWGGVKGGLEAGIHLSRLIIEANQQNPEMCFP